jgi:hypothetical protein
MAPAGERRKPTAESFLFLAGHSAVLMQARPRPESSASRARPRRTGLRWMYSTGQAFPLAGMAVWLCGKPESRIQLPEDLVRRFASRVSARQRSRYVAEALSAKLSERDQMLARACEIVNGDKAIREPRRG